MVFDCYENNSIFDVTTASATIGRTVTSVYKYKDFFNPYVNYK